MLSTVTASTCRKACKALRDINISYDHTTGDRTSLQIPWDALHVIEAADIAFDEGGVPIVVAHFVTRVVTGSYKSAELRFYGKASETWCHDLQHERQARPL